MVHERSLGQTYIEFMYKQADNGYVQGIINGPGRYFTCKYNDHWVGVERYSLFVFGGPYIRPKDITKDSDQYVEELYEHLNRVVGFSLKTSL